MSWQLGPVVRGIRGHRAAALLVVVQFGIGLAITVIAALLASYVRRPVTPPSIAVDENLTVVEVQLSGRDGDLAGRRAAVLADIARVPGCLGATVVDHLPLHVLERDLDDVHAGGRALRAAAFTAGSSIARVAGAPMRAGRDFVAGDVRQDHGVATAGNDDPTRRREMPVPRDTPTGDRARTRGEVAAIVSPAFAHALWAGRDPIGMRFESRAHGPAIVVGVADLENHLFGANEVTAIYARSELSPRMVVLARSELGRAGELREALRDRLRRPGQHAEVAGALDHLRHFASPIAAVLAILAVTVSTMLLVVLMGSMGLTYFLVSARTREIGLRRAMGATQRDIVRYFLLENALLTAAGTVLGLAVVMVVLPTLFYEQENFSVSWPLIAIVVAIVVGLNSIATLIPARKAAAVPPVVASRSG